MKRQWIIDLIGADAYEKLAHGLTGSELQSVLLEVFRERARGRTPAEVRAQFDRDTFVRPGIIDQRLSTTLDSHLFAAAEQFEAVELSPLAPLGTCTSVALTDQHRIVSAGRATEVVSDPTNVLALLCAQRLKHGVPPFHLCTSQRVIRAQPLPKQAPPHYSQHFRLFVLASAGFETKDHGFTVETLTLHIRTMLAALDRLEQHGYTFGRRSVDVLATPQRAALADRVAAAVGAGRKVLEHPYYAGLRYQITCDDQFLIDGGAFDWLEKLAANRRAVFIASGTGSQLMALKFRRSAQNPFTGVS